MKVIMGQGIDWQHKAFPYVEVWIYGHPLFRAAWLTPDGVQGLYSARGADFAGDLEGEFTILIQDRAKNKRYAITSRFGMYAPYYQRVFDFDDVVIAENIRDVMPNPPVLNTTKVLEYLSWGYGTTAMTVGDTSYVEGVKRFRPATITDLDTWEETVYWNPFDKARREEAVDFGQFTERFHAYMGDVLATKEPMVMSVTGGLDTRTILAGYLAKKGSGNTMRAFTHDGNADDTALSKQICWHYGIPHTLHRLGDLNGFVSRGDFLEGLVPGLSYRPMTECVEKEAQRGGGILAVGLCGNEIWRGRLHIRIMEESLHLSPAEALIKALCTSIYFPTYPPVYSMDIDRLMLERTQENLQNAPPYALDSPYWLADWFMWQNAVPNWAGTLVRSMGRQFRVYLAMLSKDLVETMYVTPMDVRRGGEHQRHIIGHASTFLGKTRYDTSPGGIRAKNAVIGAFRPIVRNRLTAAVLNQAKVHGVVEDKTAKLYREMLDFDSMRTKAVFDRRRLEDYVKSNVNPPWVERLVSLEMWLRKAGV